MESSPAAVSVHVSGDRIPWSDRRLGSAALVKIVFVVTLVGFLSLTKGAGRAQLRYVPLVLYFAVIMGLFSVIRTRRRLSLRAQRRATLTVSDHQLTIFEPKIKFIEGGRAVETVKSAVNYQLTNIEYFAFSDVAGAPLFQRAIAIYSIDGSVQYCLRDHDAEQLTWICNWLSTALRAALR